MARNFTDLGSLFKHLENEAKKSIQKNNSKVSQTAINKGKEHVQTDVYDVYNPQRYKRTGELKENWVVEPTEDGIKIYNDREDDGKQVAYIVHEAKGYTQSFPYENIPRPFIDNAVKELRESGELTDALMEELTARGLKVKRV